MCPIPMSPSLHSRYDPVKEAVRFLDSQTLPCVPAIVVVTEPGESYLARELRFRFPESSLVAVRYQDSLFGDSDPLWNAVWRPGNGRPVVQFLLDQIPDELLPLTVFLSWKPADSVWPETATAVWRDIASLVRLQQSVMQTRAHFGKRWFSNMVWNAARAVRLSPLTGTGKPVLLAAAGPSLDRLPPFGRERFYLCAVSAAAPALIRRRYVPDLCVATDGGYWAREHLQGLPKSVPVSFPLEASIPTDVLASNPLSFLSYGGALENALFSILRLTPTAAARNGTVAGTAAMLALSLTTDNVYAAGLDLAPSRSFAHARPYASDARTQIRASRIDPESNLMYGQNLETASLDAYADWFSSRNEEFRRRFFRIGTEGRPLAGIRRVSMDSITASAGPLDRPGRFPSYSPVPEPERAALVRGWLDECLVKLRVFDDVPHPDPEAFQDLLQRDPVVAELVSTVSYGEYVRYLKRRGASPTSAETIASVSSVAADAIAVILKNAKRLEYHG